MLLHGATGEQSLGLPAQTTTRPRDTLGRPLVACGVGREAVLCADSTWSCEEDSLAQQLMEAGGRRREGGRCYVVLPSIGNSKSCVGWCVDGGCVAVYECGRR